MLEAREDFRLCGGLILNEKFLPIYIGLETGDVLYEDEIDGLIMPISPLSETAPLELKDINSLEIALRNNTYGKILGIIYTEGYAIVITHQFSAERRQYSKLFQPSTDKILISLNIVDPVIEE